MDGQKQRRTVRMLVFVLICGLALLLAACGAQGEPSDKDANGTGAAATGTRESLEKLSIMLDWYPNAVHSFIYLAKEKGYFAEAGLDVEIQMPAETNDPLRLVAANQVDLALSYQPQLVMARAEGVPNVAVAAVVRHPLNALMVKADSPIQTPKDLENRTLGYPSIPTNEAILQTMVKSDGGDPGNVTLQDIGWDIMQALSTDQVDAVLGGYINHEKLLLEKHGFPVRVIDPVDYGVPDYYELILVTSESTWEAKREPIVAFWRAAQQAQEEVAADPEAALQVLFKQQNEAFPLDEEIERQSLEILLPLMDAGEKPFGHQEARVWEEVVEWLKREGVIEKDIAPESLFVKLEE